VVVVASMAVLGALVPNIDHAAHLGGLAVGFVGGLLLIGPWPVPPGPRTRRVAHRLAMTAMIAAVLAGSAVAVAHRGDDAVPPMRRLDDFNEQLAPIDREFSAIRMELIKSAPLFDGRDVPANQDAGRAVIRDLRARAATNADRIRRVRTSDPELQAVRDSFGRAHDGQIARLDALGRYLDTGDPAALVAAREAVAVTREAMRDCEGQHVRYMTQHGLIPPPEPQRRQR
jgi:rhomboid protease GluP